MNIKKLLKDITKKVGFNIKPKKAMLIHGQLLCIDISINNKVNLLNLIKVLKELNIIIDGINKNLYHDIGFYTIELIFEFKKPIIKDALNYRISLKIKDALSYNINMFNINDIDINNIDINISIDKDLRYIKYNQYNNKKYDINNKVIDTLNIDDINYIDDLNKKHLSFNKHMIKNMLIKRDIRGLNNLFDEYLTKRGHLKYNKHKKGVKIIKKAILELYDINTNKDEYNLKDYKELSYLNNYYFMVYDEDKLKDEYNISIKGGFNYNDIEYFKTPKSSKSYKYYINLLKK